MGIQYGNLTLYGISQQELINYLSEISEEAYVSSTFDRVTILYASYFENDLGRKQNLKFKNLDTNWKKIFKQYHYSSLAPLVFFAFHLSKFFHVRLLVSLFMTVAAFGIVFIKKD
ncbi:hypothetical protein PN466_02805 [Roseofilum reptotaenium CS-1145]|uniref:Uncharacterized protein n=1 Tax=Roseofilum reptotaenium AO1-A TaxID=1925591 RepID=A0A1L9QS47_9CYAN|nr:hypothetical protein [Roseofilum reptotaenium]MDB9515889.1 hypothetical protein [Roseofilum reptotaenium CS-1145]OJJ25407.1 hypothetical protein BI308_11470 [Roseofilum reptotaenium AO1-A]